MSSVSGVEFRPRPPLRLPGGDRSASKEESFGKIGTPFPHQRSFARKFEPEWKIQTTSNIQYVPFEEGSPI